MPVTPISLEAIPFPVGSTNAQLYQNQMNLVAALRRALMAVQANDVDLTPLETAVTAVQTDIATIEDNVTDLTSLQFQSATEIAALAAAGVLTAEEMAQLAAEDAQLNDYIEAVSRHLLAQVPEVTTQLEHNALATINAAIEAHRATTGVRAMVSVTDGHAELITSLSATVGVTNANVTTLEQAVATGDAALATRITTTETNVAGNTSSISSIQSSVDGVNSKLTFRVNAQNEVIGYTTIGGTPQGSYFDVVVDKFRVSKVGTAGGAALPVFAIQTVNGIAQIAFRGDMFADGTIVARNIAAGTITADKLNVTVLTAISANFGNATVLGELTGGPSGKLKINFTDGRIRATT